VGGGSTSGDGVQHRFGLTELISKNEITAYATELARRLTDVVQHAGSNDATVQALDELNEAIHDLIHYQQIKAIRNGLEREGARLCQAEEIVIPIVKVRERTGQ
jgi:flagellar biosynthesis regulator FlbT